MIMPRFTRHWPTWASSIYQPPYSLDLAPLDYHLFPELKKRLKGHHFLSNMEVIAAAETWLDGQPFECFLHGL